MHFNGPIVQWIRIPDFGSGDEGSNPSWATENQTSSKIPRRANEKFTFLFVSGGSFIAAAMLV